MRYSYEQSKKADISTMRIHSLKYLCPLFYCATAPKASEPAKRDCEIVGMRVARSYKLRRPRECGAQSGGELLHNVRIMKLEHYTVDDIFKKRIYILQNTG